MRLYMHFYANFDAIGNDRKDICGDSRERAQFVALGEVST